MAEMKQTVQSTDTSSQCPITGYEDDVILLIAIDEKGTTEIYKDAMLALEQFERWSINRCLKGKALDHYFKNNNKNFNANTKMWQFLKFKFGEKKCNAMKQESMNKYNSLKNTHSSLIEPLSFDQIAAIYLYTTTYLYKPLSRELIDGKSEFADFTVELICGINKLPLKWTKTYRGLGPMYTKYHSYIPEVYKKGSVVRWDGMNSTNKNKNVALQFSDKWIIEIEGYHGRDIQPFSQFPNEEEIVYNLSSHFIITGRYNENGKTFFKVKEMPFPWNQKAILWVDDKPINNKDIMERLERNGVMVIPRKSTGDALQFISYMKNIFLNNNKSDQFRIISNMTRYNKQNAGAILVHELRKYGYKKEICIYTTNEGVEIAINECKKFGNMNVNVTASEQQCFKFANFASKCNDDSAILFQKKEDDEKEEKEKNCLYIPKKKGKIYSKYGVIDDGNYSPQIILNLTHLNKLHKLYKVNFNSNWNVFIKNKVETHLLDLAEHFDYFINEINENKKISYNYNGLLSSKAKFGDTIIIRSKPNIPLPAKPLNIDDGEFITSLKPINFDNNDEKKEENIVKHKKKISKKIIDSLLSVDNTNKKLSSLINIESFDDEKGKNDNTNNKKHNKLNLDYKLHLDLDYDKELKNKNEFLNNMKKEIAESLNVDINSIHINSVHRGSVILLITVDEKGTTEIYKDAILTSAQFHTWSINRCLKGKKIDDYYKNKNKNFNANTKMWKFLKQKFGEATYNSMKQRSIDKYNSMKNMHSTLIEPLSFDQIAAIYLYTTNYLYKPLNHELRDGKSEFADFTVELICGINKLPLIWTKTYRGLGSNFTKYHSYIPDVYKKGSVIRWDGMSSTSKKKTEALKFSDEWVIEIEGYHGRDIQPFSAYAHEDEIIYIISSHFIVTGRYNENGKIFFKVKEMPFPWNQKAILWVDDKPTNNKDLIERLEKKGIMVIPRISTHDAMQFISYMKNIFLDNTKFSKFRIISDMTRYEKQDEKNEQSQVIKNRNAGAILVNELRKQGYNQKVCIYTGNKQRAIDECKKFGHTDNIKATTSTQECFEFADY